MADNKPSNSELSAGPPRSFDVKRIPPPPPPPPAADRRPVERDEEVQLIEVVGSDGSSSWPSEFDPGSSGASVTSSGPNGKSPAEASTAGLEVGGVVVDVDQVYFAEIPADLAERMKIRLAEAAQAFNAERYLDADRLLASIERLAPGAVEVIELRGLTWYRLGRWRKAAAELERFAQMTASTEQHPVLADCYRALRQWTKVAELWEELQAGSQDAELLEEGRLVYAGAQGDQGRLVDAIRLLESAALPSESGAADGVADLKRWYALGDLYERIGELSRARRLFGLVAQTAPGFGDTEARIASLA